jgi:hypothetical protein
VLVEPSPKVQAQAEGLPVEVSEKATTWPPAGADGEKVKEATGAVTVGDLPSVTLLVQAEPSPADSIARRRSWWSLRGAVIVAEVVMGSCPLPTRQAATRGR